MKKVILCLTAILLCLLSTYAQQTEQEKAENLLATQGELTFIFNIENENQLELFTNNLSIVHFDPKTNTVKAWANTEQFRLFEEKNIDFKVPMDLNMIDETSIYDVRPLARKNIKSKLTFPLGIYPTYAEYAQQMQDFEDDYPALVEKVSIGTTGQGDKELLFVKISDNVSVDESEPKLMFTSSMHGDEIAGYPMMLTLIDYILKVYNDKAHADHIRIKNLVENAEIWINPSANPDGTYHNSKENTSVANARRGNSNNVDLNRNYPDNVAGAHPDGEVYQTETIAFMNFANQHNFVIAANFHGGTELVNYPFDNAYATSQYTHADSDWYELIGIEYATHCQKNANAGNTSTPTYTNKVSYMTDDNDWDANAGNKAWHNNYAQSPGVTHGAEWYRVFGGRQDYMNFYHQCRETTIELSDTKILPESSLIDYWYYTRDALLDYLTQGTFGFRGIVKDASTYNIIEGAIITVIGHDAYGSEVSSDSNGDFYRPIKGGTYDLMVSAPCYQSVTLSSQFISDYSIVDLSDILLIPTKSDIPENLYVTNIISSSATINWSSNTGSKFDLRYREVGSLIWTEIVDINTNSYNLSKLNPKTNYEYEVRSNCGSSSSFYSTTNNFTTGTVSYCNAQSNSLEDEYIGEVILNEVSNNSIGSSTSGYSNYRSLSVFSPIEIGSSNNTISVMKYWKGTQYNKAVSAWIDYNHDGIFTNDEKILEVGAFANPKVVSNTFTIPNYANTGDTVMRVIMKYYNNTKEGAIQTDPCESFAYGEVEDYTINLFEKTLSIANSTIDEVKVHPNPFTSNIDIEIPSTFSGHLFNINIFDALSRMVYSDNIELTNSNNIRVSNLNSIQKGTYIVVLKDLTTNKSVVKQLIKQ
jgi:hypothetical protein